MNDIERKRLTIELENHKAVLKTILNEKPKDRLDDEAKKRAISLVENNILVLEGLLK